MPQVDLDTLVSACSGGGLNDRKIACEETMGDGDHQPDEVDNEELNQPDIPQDYPPESFWLSKDAEFDWFDRNAFYERKESTKGGSNSTNLNPHSNSNPGSNSNSQRFSMNLKSKASIIGLPKPQKTSYADVKNRRNLKTGNTRLFPKRNGTAGKSGKSDTSLVEPGSPKVSCMGRVRSKRDRKKRLKNRHSSIERNKAKEKLVEKNKIGFFASFRAIFQTGRRSQAAAESSASLAVTVSPPRKSVTFKARETVVSDIDTPSMVSVARSSTDSAPPALGGMTRFDSGRRSGSWGVGEA